MFRYNPDNKIIRLLERYFDMMLAFVLWLLCCTPILTIGASSVAYSTVLMDLARNDERSSIAGRFFNAFKKSFAQATLLWLTLLGLAGIVAANFYALWRVMDAASTISLVLKTTTIFFGICLIFVMIYIFPTVGRFHVTYLQALRNAAVLSFRHILYSLTLVLELLGCVLLLYYLEVFSPFFIAIVFYLMAKTFSRIFAPFDGTSQCPEEQQDV